MLLPFKVLIVGHPQGECHRNLLRILHEQLEQWTAQQIEHMLHPLLQAPGARKDVDVAALAWLVSLLFWRLAEVPLQEPDTVVTTITDMLYHTLFTDEIK